MTGSGEDEHPPDAFVLPVRPVVRLDDGTCVWFLPQEFRGVLAVALGDLRDRILARDAGTTRLFPTAYQENPDLEEEWQRLMGDELLASRLAMIETVEQALEQDTLSDEHLDALLRATNALRLVLAAELGVDRNDWTFAGSDAHPAQGALYEYLGFLLHSVIEALDSTG